MRRAAHFRCGGAHWGLLCTSPLGLRCHLENALVQAVPVVARQLACIQLPQGGGQAPDEHPSILFRGCQPDTEPLRAAEYDLPQTCHNPSKVSIRFFSWQRAWAGPTNPPRTASRQVPWAGSSRR
ncbi:hypothetical protein Q4I28_000174 [Leishmania naiffi]|uniref:Uncharacterized protein n=1 Tax=Leishmania naiffi TaxID=5678 RepID=A0AAW3CCV7_9TRYP